MRGHWYFVSGIVAAVAVISVLNLFEGRARENSREIHPRPYSEFLDDVEAGRVDDVVVRYGVISGRMADGTPFWTHAVDDPGLVERLHQRDVRFSAEPEPEPVHPLFQILISWFPIIVLAAVIYHAVGRQTRALRLSRLHERLGDVSEQLGKLAVILERTPRGPSPG